MENGKGTRRETKACLSSQNGQERQIQDFHMGEVRVSNTGDIVYIDVKLHTVPSWV